MLRDEPQIFLSINYSDTERGFIPHRLFLISKTPSLLCKWVIGPVSLPRAATTTMCTYEYLSDPDRHLACFFSNLKAFWNTFTSLEAGRGTQDSNGGNHEILQPQWITGSVCAWERLSEREENKKKEKKKRRKGTEERRPKVLRKGSIPSTAQVHDLSPVIEMAKSLQISSGEGESISGIYYKTC